MLADDVPSWHRGRSKADGTPFYLAPSRTQAGVAHRCTSYGCTCRGFERYGRCAHSAAVKIHEQSQQATAAPALKLKARYEDLFRVCRESGCDDEPVREGEGRCRRHVLVDAF
jgi:hypothetical protein